ncbi:MAG TPA: hypothetical protein VG937_38990 [Polyangiaceae bacterium]|nr:hypothetical protein [Polyangiaceae bacterium]
MPSCKPSNSLVIAVLCGVWLALSSAPSARAESASALRSLEVLLVGEVGRDPTFAARVSSWFDPAKFEVVVRAAPVLDASRVLEPSRNRALSAWVVVEHGAAHLYFASPASGGTEARFLLRTLSLSNGLDEIGAERVAEVLHLSALALLEGELHSERAELERSLGADGAVSPSKDGQAMKASASELPPRAAPQREIKQEAGAAFELGLGYGLSVHPGEGVWHGPRARVALSLAHELSALLLARSALPANHDLGEMELRVVAAQLTLAVGARHSLTSSLAIEALLGPGVDVVDYRPVSSAVPQVELGDGATEARPNLSAGLGVVLGQTSFRLALLAELELSFSKTHYDLVLPAGRRVLAEPSPFISHVGAELRF